MPTVADAKALRREDSQRSKSLFALLCVFAALRQLQNELQDFGSNESVGEATRWVAPKSRAVTLIHPTKTALTAPVRNSYARL